MIPGNHDVVIRSAAPADAGAVARVYNHYIADTIITFEEEPVSAGEMAERIREVQSAELPWLVAVREEEILGFAYAGKWKGRCAYKFSVETTVYLDPGQTSWRPGNFQMEP